jgi:cell division protein FtsL
MSPAEAERERLASRAAESAVPAPGPAHYEPEESRRHLRLVDREARRKTNRRHLIVSVALAGTAVVFLALVALHVLIAENQFRLDNLQQQASVQQERYEKLRLEVAQLEAPARIVSVAEGKLGMRQPGSVTYLPATPTSAAPGAQAGASSAPVTATVKGGTGAGHRGAAGTVAALAGTVAAPQGDADWPLIKQYLSGSP